MKLNYNGNCIEFEEFPIDYSNTVKIRVHNNGQDGEGCWVFITNDDMDKYDNNSCEYVIRGVLANDLLCFYPEKSFEMFISSKCMKPTCPECDLVKFNMEPKLFHLKKMRFD